MSKFLFSTYHFLNPHTLFLLCVTIATNVTIFLLINYARLSLNSSGVAQGNLKDEIEGKNRKRPL